jgi:hypothetical protein
MLMYGTNSDLVIYLFSYLFHSVVSSSEYEPIMPDNMVISE